MLRRTRTYDLQIWSRRGRAGPEGGETGVKLGENMRAVLRGSQNMQKGETPSVWVPLSRRSVKSEGQIYNYSFVSLCF